MGHYHAVGARAGVRGAVDADHVVIVVEENLSSRNLVPQLTYLTSLMHDNANFTKIHMPSTTLRSPITSRCSRVRRKARARRGSGTPTAPTRSSTAIPRSAPMRR